MLPKVRSAELTPVPPTVDVMVERPASIVTAPKVSDEAVWARPRKVKVPPRSFTLAASLMRLPRSTVPVLPMDRAPA